MIRKGYTFVVTAATVILNGIAGHPDLDVAQRKVLDDPIISIPALTNVLTNLVAPAN